MVRQWWREAIPVLLIVVALSGAFNLSTDAQTLGVGVKLPVELANFMTANLTDNFELFGQLRVAWVALEAGVLFPFVPLVVDVHLKFDFFSVRYLPNAEGTFLSELKVLLSGGGLLISIAGDTFIGLVGKLGAEWVLSGLPLRVLLEAGWQSSIELLQGSGGPFVNIGVRWDL